MDLYDLAERTGKLNIGVRRGRDQEEGENEDADEDTARPQKSRKCDSPLTFNTIIAYEPICIAWDKTTNAARGG